MIDLFFIRFSWVHFLRGLVLMPLALLLSVTAAAEEVQQVDPSTIAPTRLLQEINARVTRGRYIEARPFMRELEARLSEGTEEDKRAVQPIYYLLALSYLQEYGRSGDRDLLENAVGHLSTYISENPDGDFIIEALRRRVDTYRGQGEFIKAADDLETLLGDPYRRRLTRPQEIEAFEKITEALHLAQNYERGLPFFRRFFELAENPEQRAAAASAIIEGLIETGQEEEVFDFLPSILVDSPSRYNITLNLALLRMGDRMANERRFSEAALLYDVVLTPREMREYFERRTERLGAELERMRRLRIDEERQMAMEVSIENAQAEIERLDEISDYSPELFSRQARNFFLARRDFESFWAYLRLVDDFPDHPNIEDFKLASFMTAVRAGLSRQVRELGERFLDEDASDEFRLNIMSALAQNYYESGDFSSFTNTAWNLINDFPEESETAQVIFMMGNRFIEEGRFDTLLSEFLPLENDENLGENRAAVLYWLGLGHLFSRSYGNARDNFAQLLEVFPEAPYVEDARYRYAMAFYAGDDTDRARELFEDFVRDYPQGELRGEVEYFLGEIEASEGTDMQVALDHYARVEQYTENQGYIDAAYRQKSELLERNGLLEEMEELWRTYLSRHGEAGDLASAIYELGRAQRKLGKPGEMVASFQDAVFRFGNDPLNDGVDLVLMEYLTRYEETVERLDATIGFFEKLKEDEEFRKKLVTDRAFLFEFFQDNPEIEPTLYEEFRNRDELGEPLINDLEPAEEYLAFFQKQRDEVPGNPPEVVFSERLPRIEERGRRTLQFRLLMGLDKLGEDVSVPTVYEEDLPEMSPMVLAWLAERERENNPDFALAAAEYLLRHFPESESALTAYEMRAALAWDRGDLEEALEAYEAAEDEFPAHPQISRVILSRGRVLLEMGQYEAARNVFQDIRRVPEWRGEAHAEAIHMVGVTYFNEANNASGEDREKLLRSAHGFFQHVFVMYPYFREWAGKSYVKDSKTLLALGAEEDARRTLDEFLGQSEFEGTEAFGEARQMRATL